MSIGRGKDEPREHVSYRAMIQRCHNPNSAKYPTYGAIGVRVCAEWRGRGGYQRFLSHMGPKPTPEHTLDRFPNPKGNYEPGNVRWATKKEQSWNSSVPVMVQAGEGVVPLSELERRTGIGRHSLKKRVESGMDLTAPIAPASAKAVATKRVAGFRQLLTLDGETLSVSAWAKRAGIGRKALKQRLESGLSLVEALAKPSRQTVTAEQVLEIRARSARGERVYLIARALGMRAETVSKIAKGERHREVA